MSDQQKLHILWTNADVLTSQFMVMMYAVNAKKNRWWDEVTVIIWGATAKLAAENNAIQQCVETAQNVGVEFSACEACARELGVTEKLRALNIEVKYWGKPLTELLKEGANLLTI